MKIIFSRKGVDSAAGGCASPIIQGRPISIPIPTLLPTPIRYGDLAEPASSMIGDLSGGRLLPDAPCHLDPDIRRTALQGQRLPGWRGAFGQIGAALSHLRNAEIGADDLFLFWGLYRSCARTSSGWRYVGPRRHGIFGWLQVAEIVDLGADGSHVLAKYNWLQQHPHARSGWSRLNAMFIAREHLSFGDGALAGYGYFDRLIPLSWDSSDLPSTWDVPAWLDPTAGGVSMTYHPPRRWLGDGRLRSAPRGQEFVADIGDRRDARAWLLSLFQQGRT